MTEKIRITGISGSLRRGSYNTALLRAIGELGLEAVEYDIVTLADVPLFNEDVERQGWPPRVQVLRDRLTEADGIILATPEYNYSISGVLKNAIDWLSRPERKGPIFGKPAAIIGASVSRIGTARAQAHLRQVAFYNGMPLIPDVEILVAGAADKFDEAGRLTDSLTRELIQELGRKFAAWVRHHKARRSRAS